MKKLLMTAVYSLSLLATLPIYAACPLADTNSPKPAPKRQMAVAHTQKMPVQTEPFWHDLHWFE